MATDAEAGLPRRFLRWFLLLAIDNGEASHGYELFEAVKARRISVELAGVYRELRAMQRHDLVTSWWEPSESGPARRVYELTAEGHGAAALAAAELVACRDALSSAIRHFGLDDEVTASAGGP